MESEIESYKKAGKIASEVREEARKFIVRGRKLVEVAEFIEGRIRELGGEVAFPTNLSINEVAAHYTPSLDDEKIAEGLLKVDLGVSCGGFIADTAFSLDLTEDKKFEEMIKLNERVLEETLDSLSFDSVVSDVGNSIQGKVEDYNENNGKDFVVVRNLSGHSLGEDLIHAGLTISNYANDNNTSLKNEAVAIEPFLTCGNGEIYEGKKSEIYSLSSEKSVRDSDARKVLAFIKENYKTKPFCKRWLEKEGFKKLGFVLSSLTRQGIIHNYSVLVEKTKQPVSQAEHTVLITEKEVVVTTK